MLRSLYQPLNVWQSWAPHAIIVATICHRLKDENVSPVTDTLNFVSHLYSLSPGGKQFSYFGMSQKPKYIVALSLVAALNNCLMPSSEFWCPVL